MVNFQQLLILKTLIQFPNIYRNELIYTVYEFLLEHGINYGACTGLYAQLSKLEKLGLARETLPRLSDRKRRFKITVKGNALYNKYKAILNAQEITRHYG